MFWFDISPPSRVKRDQSPAPTTAPLANVAVFKLFDESRKARSLGGLILTSGMSAIGMDAALGDASRTSWLFLRPSNHHKAAPPRATRGNNNHQGNVFLVSVVATSPLGKNAWLLWLFVVDWFAVPLTADVFVAASVFPGVVVADTVGEVVAVWVVSAFAGVAVTAVFAVADVSDRFCAIATASAFLAASTALVPGSDAEKPRNPATPGLGFFL